MRANFRWERMLQKLQAVDSASTLTGKQVGRPPKLSEAAGSAISRRIVLPKIWSVLGSKTTAEPLRNARFVAVRERSVTSEV